jgi:hypothetical protein
VTYTNAVLAEKGRNLAVAGHECGAINADAGLVFASTWNVRRIQQLALPQATAIGATSTGVIAGVAEIKPGDVLGYFW